MAARITIRTRYVTRPGSNVGTYRATGAGRTFTAPARQDLDTDARHEIAARALAAILSGFDPQNVREWARRTPTPAHGATGAEPPLTRSDNIPPARVMLWPQGERNGARVWKVTP